MYRQFWLINGNGEKYTFTDKNSKVFLNTPTGLGMSKSVSGYTLGNVLKVTTKSYGLPSITGDLLFYDKRENAYEDYFNFMKFLSLEPIFIYYQPANTLTPYFAKCEVTIVEKGEFSTDGAMHCSIGIMNTTHWLNSNERVLELTNTNVGSGKFYDLTRDYYYAGGTLSNINLQNDGSESVGFTIEIDGDVTNPQWTISQYGKTYGTCKINGSYDYVKVNSVDAEQSIYLENDGASISNPSSYQDLSITNGGALTFIKIKTGQSTMVFTCGNIDTFNGTIKIRYNESFVSV